MVASSQQAHVLNVVQELSDLLNTGLTRDELDTVLKLVQEGENPQGLVASASARSRLPASWRAALSRIRADPTVRRASATGSCARGQRVETKSSSAAGAAAFATSQPATLAEPWVTLAAYLLPATADTAQQGEGMLSIIPYCRLHTAESIHMGGLARAGRLWPKEAVTDLLVGSAGQEFISNELNSNPNIENSINVIKAKGALPDARVKPLLEFLDNLQLSSQVTLPYSLAAHVWTSAAQHAWTQSCYCRAESFHGVLEGAKKQLFKFMEHVPPEALLDLLEVSFPYIGLRDLKDVPLAILHKINPVPAVYLRQIAADNDLFRELPIDVQRQVWDMDKKLLQVHAMQQVAVYTSDQATLIRAMDMDQFLSLAPAQGGSSGAHPSENVLLGHQVPRKQLRKFNPALRKLVEMVGSSLRIYKGITQLLRARLKDAQGLVMGMQVRPDLMDSSCMP
ncbi:Cofactor of BRCA1 [Pseudocyphellaria aurata]|nr:Cofactor of BRCA1 [Pseudocyphellaria aurata]